MYSKYFLADSQINTSQIRELEKVKFTSGIHEKLSALMMINDQKLVTNWIYQQNSNEYLHMMNNLFNSLWFKKNISKTENQNNDNNH